MLVSIVTAVWNRAATIGQSMASVRAQSYPQIEHILQDGGSTDGTLEVIAAQSDTRTELASAPDSGLYDALNKGIARATGDVIGLVHSDDYLAAPDVLARVARVFEDPQVDAVYGDLDYITPQGDRLVRSWRSGPFERSSLWRGWMPPHPTLYLRRRVLAAHGTFDTSFRISADYDAVLRYFSQPGFRAVHIPSVFVRMRVGGASNASLGRVLVKSREDYRALRKNRITPASLALAGKNLSKIGQFARFGAPVPPTIAQKETA
ncbi:MAG: glycosyltransferase family 2 protein [Pseudomonadota bacterium]